MENACTRSAELVAAIESRDAARENFLTMQGAAAQLLKRAETAELIARNMSRSLTWTIAEIEKRAEYTELGQFDSLLARAKHDRDLVARLPALTQ